MNTVQQWTACVCLAVLAVSLLQHFLPEGALRRMAELTAGAFLLASFLTPLLKSTPDLSFLFSFQTEASYDHLSDTVERQQEDAVRESIASLVAAELAREGIPCEGIEVFVNTEEDKSISINKIAVTLPADSSSACDRAAAVLFSSLGLKAEVTANVGE